MYTLDTGFPIKRCPLLNIENIPDLLSNDMEGKTVEISTFNILAIGRLLWETLYNRTAKNHCYVTKESLETVISVLCLGLFERRLMTLLRRLW